ncbi:MAG TPA: oxalate/formate MFS antiporter [Verrucomicrobiae bacterium]|jgi:OFA family oxalate/formate antiporter-like MFS transporter|nr:oxalate/formate MFS antiporter [Verrucomicrobiae bacterium]
MGKRWIQFTSAVVAMIMIANLQYAWTLFVKPLQQGHKDWDLVGIQWAGTLFLVFETWVTPVEGWLIDRLGPRIFLSVGGLLVGIGWSSMGYAQSLKQLYVLYAIAGVGAAFIYSGSVATALKWFPDKRGAVSGFITAGFGAGSALFIPMIAFTLKNYGYRTAFLYTGIGQGLLILIAAQFLHNPGPDFHISKAARAPVSPRIRRNTAQFNSLQMLMTPHFYLLFFTFVLINVGGSMVTIQSAPVADYFKISAAALTAALATGRLANGAGRIFWGWLSDRVGREMAMFVPYVLQAFSLIAVITVGRKSGLAFTITLAVVYFIWGSMFSLFPAIIGDYFGANNATSNYGFLYMAKGVAAVIAGGTAALIFKRYGNWNAVFYGSAGLAMLSAVLVLIVRALPLPTRNDDNAGPAVATAKAG